MPANQKKPKKPKSQFETLLENDAQEPLPAAPSAQDDPDDYKTTGGLLEGRPQRGFLESSSTAPSAKKRRCYAGLLKMRYYLSHARREARGRWVNYALAVLSCMLVVMVASVCFTILERSPIILLQEAEAANAEADMSITMKKNHDHDGGGPAAGEGSINYTRIATATAAAPAYQHHAPRMRLPTKLYQPSCLENISADGNVSDVLSSEWMYSGPEESSVKGCNAVQEVGCVAVLCKDHAVKDTSIHITLIDTAREASIGLGRGWAFPPVPPGQVLMSELLASKMDLKPGQVFIASITLTDVLQDMAAAGYALEALPNLEENQAYLADVYNAATKLLAVVHVPLVLASPIGDDEIGGKFKEFSSNLIVMEYQHLLPLLLDRLHPLAYAGNLTSLLPLLATDERRVVLSKVSQSQESGDAGDASDAEYAGDAGDAGDVVDAGDAGDVMLPWSLEELVRASGEDLHSYASTVKVNLPPPRIEVYMESNYQKLQGKLVMWSADLIYLLGVSELTADLPILNVFETNRMRSLYLGLILSIILAILFILSVMLIYSLLTISIQTRTFELGVQRMIGLTRRGIVELLIVQSFTFSLPSWVIGLVIAQLATNRILTDMMAGTTLDIDKRLSPTGVVVASFLGLLAPIVASILPIRQALAMNLNDNLDSHRSKTKGVTFSIERTEDTGLSWAWLTIGMGLSLFGFLIYYLLPLTLLSYNLALFGNIFFMLLIGMLFGLVLLSLNAVHLVERVVVWAFFWWEKRAISTIVLKNLIAHRVRNRKTTIMYSLSLSFILFITVAYKVERQTALSLALKRNGQYLVVKDNPRANPGISWKHSVELESALAAHPQAWEDYSWVSVQLAENVYSSTSTTTPGRVFSERSRVRAVSPNYFDVVLDEYNIAVEEETSTGLSWSEQLYTPAGSQAAVVCSSLQEMLLLDDTTFGSNFLLKLEARKPKGIQVQPDHVERLRPLAILESGSGLRLSKFKADYQDLLVSFSTFLRLTGGRLRSVQDMTFYKLVVRLKPDASDLDMNTLVAALKSKAKKKEVFDFRAMQAAMLKTDAVINTVFTVATYVAMGLCLFSLMASMYSNIYEQSKEIAVLRALGLRRWQIVRIYVYEAFTLTTSAAVMGTFIGTVLANTIIGQRALFTQVPMSFQFPYREMGLTVAGSLLCAIASSFVPALKPSRRPIAQVMRMML